MAVSEPVQVLRDAVAWKPTGRIPTISNYWTYMIVDAGQKRGEALYNTDILYDCVTRFHEKYQFDCYNYIGVNNATQFKVVEPFGGHHYIVDDERDIFGIKDACTLEASEYSEFVANPMKCLWEKVLPRKYKHFNDSDNYERMKAAIAAQKESNDFAARVRKKFFGEYGVTMRGWTTLACPDAFFFSFILGIKEFSILMRKNMPMLVDMCNAWAEYTNVDSSYNVYNKDLPDDEAFTMWTSLLAYSVMNRKQFETLVWPYLKKALDLAAETHKNFFLFTEASIGRFADLLADYPKGTLAIQPEQDDVFELRKQLPNAAICGGMPTTLLGKGTKEECIDYAKKIADELGACGGLVMGQDKMMTFRSDAKSENILAVQEFCRTYKG